MLVDTVDGERLTFASNVAAHPDGTIWFTTSTSRWDLEHHRLLRRDPDGTVTTLLSGLAFANGLVLAPDGSHLLFAEAAGYRVSRYWLTGPRAGGTEPLVEDLPGFPDDTSLGGDGLLRIGIAAPRNALLDRLLPRPASCPSCCGTCRPRCGPRPPSATARWSPRACTRTTSWCGGAGDLTARPSCSTARAPWAGSSPASRRPSSLATGACPHEIPSSGQVVGQSNGTAKRLSEHLTGTPGSPRDS